MDLRYGDQYEAFRSELREFLRGWPLCGEEASLPPGEQEALFRQRGIDRGYVYRNFPAEYGGSEREFDVLIDSILQQEYTAAGAPGEFLGPGPSIVVPTLLEAGSEALKQRFIPPTLRGEIAWCQGYSEPGAGSDLAALQSRAELDGDEWVLQGHKIWTSGANQADYMFGLFRTESGTQRHAGISFLIVDMKQLGIEIEPIRELTGAAHFNEVRFEGARTPTDWTVGERGQGWRVSNITLRHERAMLSDVGSLENLFAALVELAQRKGRSKDPVVRLRMVDALGELESHCWTVRRRLSAIAHGREADVALSTLMLKYCATRLRTKIVAIADDLIAANALLVPDQVLYKNTPSRDDEWLAAYLRAHAYSIGGGTPNIQLNIIGERGLGLPRDLRRKK